MDDAKRHLMTAGGAIFPRLGALGVDYVFANSGTDFPPIIEGLAEAATTGRTLPQALVLTAIVISFGMTAVVVMVALGAFLSSEDDHIDDQPPSETDEEGAAS